MVVVFERNLLKRKSISRLKRKCFILEILVTVVLLTSQAALFAVYRYLTDSRFIESFYSVFVNSSTIGFGDFKYNTEEIGKKSDVIKTMFQMSDLVLKYLNLAMLASVFTALSEFKWKESGRCCGKCSETKD